MIPMCPELFSSVKLGTPIQVTQLVSLVRFKTHIGYIEPFN